jgi:hypothetical protein
MATESNHDAFSSFHDDFYARGDSLRAKFGGWDCCDPVAHVILDLVEAQTELADAIDDYANYGGDFAAIETAMKKRGTAAKKLLPAIDEHEDWL